MATKLNSPLGIYAIASSYAELKLLFAQGITTAQLRIKNLPENNLEQETINSISLAKKYSAKLFINDYWQLAIQHQAFGVHLGQEDLAKLSPNELHKLQQSSLQLGISTHNLAEIDLILPFKPSYIAIGPIFNTLSKKLNYDCIGLDNLTEWVNKLAYPVVAIGGINLQNIESVLKTGVSGVAMIQAFKVPQAQLATTVQQLLKKGPAKVSHET